MNTFTQVKNAIGGWHYYIRIISVVFLLFGSLFVYYDSVNTSLSVLVSNEYLNDHDKFNNGTTVIISNATIVANLDKMAMTYSDMGSIRKVMPMFLVMTSLFLGCIILAFPGK